ncbi:TasA family protein [Chloroflexota bacterium]
MKKILGLSIALVLLTGMTGIGTWAYFSDVETSTGNVLAAGTLDLKTDDVDGVTQTIYTNSLEPGEDISGSITLKNAGSVAGLTLDIVASYIESDNGFNLVDTNVDDTAAKLELTTLSYGGSSLLGSVSDNNVNSYLDVEDLKNANLTGQSGIGPSATKDFTITVQLRSDTAGDFQSDGINITITFTLNQ